MSSRQIVDDVRQGAQHAYEKTEATAEVAKVGVLDAIGRVSEIYRALRSLGLDDVLSPVGLQRKRGPALSMGMFGMGLAAGAVLGVMLAPASGRDARRAIATRFTELLQNSGSGVQHAVEAAKGVAKDAASEVAAADKKVADWSMDQQGSERARQGFGAKDSPPNGRVRS
jgi:gas vesicle protein